MEDEEPTCAFTHLKIWISKYEMILGRKLIPTDPLFPHANESITEIRFGEKMVHSTFMKTVNKAVSEYGIIPKHYCGEELGKFTAICFRRGGAQRILVTGKARWPLDIVKRWGGHW